MKMAFGLMLFFLCLNVSVWAVNELQVLPVSQSPYSDPTTISVTYITTPTSLAFMGVLVLAGILTRNPYVTLAGLIVFAVERLLPFGGWVISGFPTFIGMLSGNTIILAPITVALQVLFYFVWFMAIMEFLSGRLTQT